MCIKSDGTSLVFDYDDDVKLWRMGEWMAKPPISFGIPSPSSDVLSLLCSLAGNDDVGGGGSKSAFEFPRA